MSLRLSSLVMMGLLTAALAWGPSPSPALPPATPRRGTAAPTPPPAADESWWSWCFGGADDASAAAAEGGGATNGNNKGATKPTPTPPENATAPEDWSWIMGGVPPPGAKRPKMTPDKVILMLIAPAFIAALLQGVEERVRAALGFATRHGKKVSTVFMPAK